MPVTEELLTTTEISNLFKVNRVTVTQWISGGKLPAIRTLGGYLRVPREDLIRFLRSNNMPLPRGLRPERPTAVVADDDADFLKLLKRKLTARFPELRVETAEGGVEALIRLGELKPDLLILDIVMPEMDGIEVIRRIKKDAGLAGLQIIALSGHPDRSRQAVAAGAAAFFSKRGRLQDIVDRLPELVPALRGKSRGW